LVEHFSCKEDVVGSIPAPGSDVSSDGWVVGRRVGTSSGDLSQGFEAMTIPQHHLEIQGPIDDAGRTVLVLAGDVDLATSPELRERIEEAGVGGGTVVIDLREVRFMDSPGLGTLIYCRQALERYGATLVVRSPQGHVRELFDVVQLASVLSIE
jgi:anti-sigma B factor antagonist